MKVAVINSTQHCQHPYTILRDAADLLRKAHGESTFIVIETEEAEKRVQYRLVFIAQAEPYCRNTVLTVGHGRVHPYPVWLNVNLDARFIADTPEALKGLLLGLLPRKGKK